jgi:6-phosphogluconolactonase
MKFSKFGRILSALVATAALGLGMTACGGGTIGYMWIVGTYYNQISGFKIDDYTGNLTTIPGTPFSTNGKNPSTVLVKSGGRFVYVINSGTAATAPTATSLATQSTPGNISLYSVGGEGTLTFQQTFVSQGIHPIWATFDSTGNYLYVVDQYAPDNTGNGSITAFTVAADTGRLSLLQNAAIKNANGTLTNYFSLAPNPVMTKVGGGTCLYTITSQSSAFPNSANYVYPYVINSSNGQLTLATTGPYTVSGASSLSSINTGTGTSGSAYTYLTDTTGNQIFSLTSGANCALSPISGSQQTNVSTALNPVNSLTSNNGKFLYVINQSNTSSGTQTIANSTISAFTIDTSGRLATLIDTSNPYAIGSGPVCVVQDPSNQYLYTSNNTASTVTGKQLREDTGTLADLVRGSVFPVTMNPTCMAVSGSL